MKLFWNILRLLLALFMIYAGSQHFIKPEFFNAFVPDFLIYKSSNTRSKAIPLDPLINM